MDRCDNWDSCGELGRLLLNPIADGWTAVHVNVKSLTRRPGPVNYFELRGLKILSTIIVKRAGLGQKFGLNHDGGLFY